MLQDKKLKSVAEAVSKIMAEDLKGKQHKLDVAEPKGKLTSADFKKLRSMKKEEAERIDEVKLADLPKRTVKGKSYGADYEDPEGKDDADDKPAQPEKRGRGRPKGTFKRRFNTKLYKESFAEMLQTYDNEGLKFVAEMIQEEPTNDEYTAEVKDAQEKSEGKGKKAEVAKPLVQAVKNEEVEQIDERHLTSAETKKKEEVVKSMKKKLSGFRERYGKRAKEVMYATATKTAKESK
jgi:hypothetical protein